MAKVEMLKVKKKNKKRLMRKRGLMRWYFSCRNDSDKGCLRSSLSCLWTIFLWRDISPCLVVKCLLKGSRS